jgi:hypothetical protein
MCVLGQVLSIWYLWARKSESDPTLFVIPSTYLYALIFNKICANVTDILTDLCTSPEDDRYSWNIWFIIRNKEQENFFT